MTKNQIDYWRLQEDKRHQREVERETERNNRRVSRDKQVAAYLDYKARNRANIINAQHYQRMDLETNRHNLETERQAENQHQRELAKLQINYDQMKTQRDIAQIQASVGYAQVGAQYANIDEMRRANQAREALQLQQQLETQRSNRAQEALSWQNQANQTRKTNLDYIKQGFETSKWQQYGAQTAALNQTLLIAQAGQANANAQLANRNKELAGINAASNLLGAGANVLKVTKGVNSNGKSPKVQWPDGTYGY